MCSFASPPWGVICCTPDGTVELHEVGFATKLLHAVRSRILHCLTPTLLASHCYWVRLDRSGPYRLPSEEPIRSWTV